VERFSQWDHFLGHQFCHLFGRSGHRANSLEATVTDFEPNVISRIKTAISTVSREIEELKGRYEECYGYKAREVN
jgi:hypothetical protein